MSRCPWGWILTIGCLLSAGAWPTLAAADNGFPRFTAKQGKLHLVYQDRDPALLRSSLVLREPRLHVVRGEAPEPADEEEELPVPGEVAREAAPVPVDVESIAIHDATLSFLDPVRSREPLLQIHDVQVLVENFTTNRRFSDGLPTMISARGRIGTEGEVSLFATVNTWSDELDFAGRAQITGLRLEQIAALVEDTADISPTEGSISVFIEFSVRKGQITGTMKPFLTDVSVEPAGPGFADQLKSWAAGGAIQLLSRGVGGEQRLATEIALTGNLTDPNTSVWDALVGVVINAFIQAIAVGYG